MAENKENQAATGNAAAGGGASAAGGASAPAGGASASAAGGASASASGAAKAAGSKSSLFREKNLERLESPEKLNDYLRVTSPGVWLVLATVIVLLIGVCIWGVFGTIQATTQAAVVTQEGQSTCLVPAAALQGVLENRTVEIDGVKMGLEPAVLEPDVISDSTNVYIMLAGGLKVGDIVYPITLTEPLKADGIVTGTLVTETLSPMSLFFN